MAVGTISQFDALALDVYPAGSEIFENVNQGTPALDLIESGNTIPFFGKFEGRKLVIPAQVGANPNSGVGVGESGSNPTGTVSNYDKLTYNVATHTQGMTMTGLSMASLTGGDRSVADVLPNEMRAQTKAFRRKLGWLLHRDGSGSAGTFATSGNSASTLVLATGTDMTIIDVDGEFIVRDLDQGTRDTGQTVNLALKVSAKSSYTLTLAHTDGTSYTPVSSDMSAYGLYWYDSQGSSMIGFEAYCDDANPLTWGSTTAYLGNVNRSTAANAWWRAYQVSAGSVALDLITHIQPTLDKINERAGSEIGADDMLLGFVRYSNWRTLGNQLSKDQRTFDKPKQLTGGWEGIQYENCMFVRDRDAPYDKVRIVNPKKLYRYIMTPVGWDDTDGSIWQRQTNSDGRSNNTFKALLLTRQQMVGVSCLCNAEIQSISASN